MDSTWHCVAYSVCPFPTHFLPFSVCYEPREADPYGLSHQAPCPLASGWLHPLRSTGRRLEGGERERLVDFFYLQPYLLPELPLGS